MLNADLENYKLIGPVDCPEIDVVMLDVYLGRRFVVTPSFAAGLYAEGGGKDLGHVLEFRSQIEVAYRFEDRSRLGLSFSHISNASISSTTPVS